MKPLAEIVVDCPLKDINKTFHYTIPLHLEEFIDVGSRVLVPFNNRTVQGFVIRIEKNWDKKIKYRLKDVLMVYEYPAILDSSLIGLAQWMSYNYCASLFSCIQSMLPRGVKLQLTELFTLTKETLDVEFNDFFKKPRTLSEIISQFSVTKEQINDLLRDGYLAKDLNVKTIVKEKHHQLIFLNPNVEEIIVPTNALRQQQLLELLSNQETIVLSELPTGLRNAANTMMEKGYILSKTVEVYREPEVIDTKDKVIKELTLEQKEVLKRINEAYLMGKEVVLLKGVTGSGKTEVYLQFVQQVVESGKEAIILVPEISLTPLMVGRFKSRFGHSVAVLHSGLTEAQKFDQWLKIKRGIVKIVVGARSAVFAPFNNLGAIIIDEEHEGTYKQEEQPRYVTKDVAEFRVNQCNGILLLGSATPSVESYHRAVNGENVLLELNKRANNMELPKIHIVDMKEELTKGNRSIFSESLQKSMEETLSKGEQAILFLNKRGFSSTTLCRSCGFTFKCPSCDVNLTSHLQGKFLICHYCNYSITNPNNCPKCGSAHIRFNGLGTEKLKDEIIKRFPLARIIRMDNDTMTTASSYNEVYQNFLEEKANVLIGTQMITKGFDFPKVTLVGIILADLSLNFPDFRSSEKTFQLITQVAGRAGRAKDLGKVILQTYTPEHFSLVTSSTYDYQAFFQEELKMRQTLNYPPFTKLAKIEVVSKKNDTGKKIIDEISSMLKASIQPNDSIEVLGPVIPAIPRLRNNYRFMLIIKYVQDSIFLGILQKINLNKYKNDIILNIKVDINPQTLL